MNRTPRFSLAVACLIACSLVLAASAARPPMPRSPRQVDQTPDPHQNTTVLVEAFVVEVDLSVLYAMDVNPLDKSPHVVSVENILECLQVKGKADIRAGAKAAVVHRTGNSRSKDTQTMYHPRSKTVPTNQGPVQRVDYVAYDTGQTLSVAAQVLEDTSARVEYDFSYSGYSGIGVTADSNAPAGTVSWSWSGNATLQAGQPAIVGAAQNNKTAVFLVLTAHIVK